MLRSFPVAVALAGLSLLAALALSGQAAAPPRSARSPDEAYLERLLQGYRRAATRVNGVKLAVTTESKGDDIRIQWAIDYTGPRSPLNILKPSLTDHAAHGQTMALFFAIGLDGKDHGIGLRPPFLAIPGPRPPTSREAYLTVKRGETGKGTLAVSASDVWSSLRDRWPGKFGERPPQHVFVQLRHSPSDRGEHLALDAWTGHLQTELVPVSLKGASPTRFLGP